MRNLILLLMLSPLSACAMPDNRTIHSTDGELKPYIEYFESIYGKVGDIPAGFEKMDIKLAGVCRTFNMKYRQVNINIDYWNGTGNWKNSGPLPEPLRIQLIFHEFGHCFLKRTHTSDMIDDPRNPLFQQIPKSFMNPKIFPYDSDNMNYYIKELGHDYKKNHLKQDSV